MLALENRFCFHGDDIPDVNDRLFANLRHVLVHWDGLSKYGPSLPRGHQFSLRMEREAENIVGMLLVEALFSISALY